MYHRAEHSNFTDLNLGYDEEQKEYTPTKHRYDKSNFISKLLFSWVSPLTSIGRHNHLSIDTLGPIHNSID